MSFARQRSPGLWTFDSVITGAELEYWDASVANALDMLGGGAYAPAADIIIGGDVGVEWTFELPVTFSDSATFNGSAVFNDDVYLGSSAADAIIVAGQTIFQSTATFNDDAEFNDPVIFNDLVTFNDPVTFTDTVGFQGAAFFDGNVNLGSSTSDALQVDAESTFSGDVTIQNAVAFEGTVVTNSVGNFRVRRVRRQTAGGDVDSTIDVTLTDHVFVLAGAITANRVYTLSDTGAVNGDRVRFSTQEATFSITVKNPSAGTMELLCNVSGSISWCDVERINGLWRSMPGDREA